MGKHINTIKGILDHPMKPATIESYLSAHYSGTCRRTEGGNAVASPKKEKGLGQVCLQLCCCLLQGSNRQGLGRAKADVVRVIAYLPMSSPGSSGQALKLTMSGEATVFSHEAKGRTRREPGKPLRSIGLKGEQTVLGTDDHVAPMRAILDQR